MPKFAVIIYGPPGSGKSTQAELVASAYGLVRFDTGKYIEEVINDPKNKKNKFIQKQKQRYESGLLCDRPWVFSIVSSQIKKIIKAGFGLVLGGSPRTSFEAFDQEGRPGVYSILKKAYSKGGIFTFLLKVKPSSSIFRNKERKICIVCGRQVVYDKKFKITKCPFCSGSLRTRKDDKPEVIKARLVEFERATKPIFEGLKKRGFKIHQINGDQPPYKVFQDIKKWLP